jgi:hypothetical protein
MENSYQEVVIKCPWCERGLCFHQPTMGTNQNWHEILCGFVEVTDTLPSLRRDKLY